MTTTEAIQVLQRRIDFLQGKIAVKPASSYEKAELSALEHAMIRMKQFNQLVDSLLKSSNVHSYDLLKIARDIELAEGKRLKGPIWKEGCNGKDQHSPNRDEVETH